MTVMLMILAFAAGIVVKTLLGSSGAYERGRIEGREERERELMGPYAHLDDRE